MSHPHPKLIELLAAVDEVAAICLGGSHASGLANAGSDLDLYVLTNETIAPSIREGIARELADDGPVEIGNPWWGNEDGYAIDGTWYDLAFFAADWFFDGIDAVVNQYRASQGYSTSFVYTLHHMQPIHDPNGLIPKWQAQTREYPESLANAIIAMNYPIVSTIRASLRNQIARAIDLDDAVAVNHRVAGLLASVFDIAFAVLRQWHPGEKRQLQYLERYRDLLPVGFAGHITAILQHSAPDRLGALLAAVDRVVDDVDQMVKGERQS